MRSREIRPEGGGRPLSETRGAGSVHSGTHLKPDGGAVDRAVVLLRPFLALVALGGAIGCGPTSVIEGRMTWSGPRFGIDYVAPPWELESESADELRLRIRAEVFGVELDGSPPTHVLVFGAVDAPSSVLDLLPVDAQPDLGLTTGLELPDSAGDVLDTDGELPDPTGALPDGWEDVDLSDPADVALVELDYLLTEQRADLVHELRPFHTDSGEVAMEYAVIVPPGLFVRSFYLPVQDGTVRALFASLFDLDDDDIDRMAATIVIGGDASMATTGEG